jgi:hypothetical protein
MPTPLPSHALLRGLLATALTFTGGWALAQTPPAADASMDKGHIDDTYKADKAACSSLSANAKDICTAEAKAKKDVAQADLQARKTGNPKDIQELEHQRIKGAYAVAKERCDDQAGNKKDVCVKEAQAVQKKAEADLKLRKETGAARTEAFKDKQNANYDVAREKCDALAGGAKDTCQASVKAQYGK